MKHAVTAALMLSLFTASAAMADPPDRHDDRNKHYDHRDDHPGRGDHRPDARGRYPVVEYHRPKSYREHKWRKGERLPPTYRTKVYVVEDYPEYHLRQPPRGYHWIRVDNDVVLVAIATGVVLEVVNEIFYQ
jgi:Ni/Co efflux regulator RcnB